MFLMACFYDRIEQDFLPLFGLSWVSFFYATVLLIALSNEKVRLFRNRILMKLGVVAYAVYLFHQAIQGFIFHYAAGKTPSIDNLNDVGLKVLAGVITLLLAWLSWEFFEKRFIALGKRFNF